MEQKLAEDIRTKFLSALDTASENYKSEQKNNTATSDGAISNLENGVELSSSKKFSIEYDKNTNTSYVLIKAIELKGDGIKSDDSLGRKARIYMRNKFQGVVLELGKTKNTYIRKEGINEYTNPAARIGDNEYKAKMLATSELDNLLKNSEYLSWKSDDGRHKDVIRWLNYKTTFAVDLEGEGIQVLQGIVKIKRINRGDVFYDITQIKNITDSNIGQSIVNNAAESIGNVSKNSISYSNENVKKSSEKPVKFSLNVNEFGKELDDDTDYSYKKLVSKPNMKITIIDDSKVYQPNKNTRSYIINESVSRAKQAGKVNENGNAVIHVDDIDEDVIIGKNAIRHSLDRRLNVNAHIDLNIGNILKKSVKINELSSRADYIEKSYVLMGIAKKLSE